MSGEHEKNPNHSVDRIRLVRQLIERMCREFETGKRMKVWWDMKNCPVPEGYDPLLVRRSIESYLYKREYHSGPLTIVAFGNLKDIPVEVLRAYSDTGIVMKHDPFFKSACANVTGDCTRFSTIMKEMGNWKVSHISTPVLFISNPENACNLYFHMKYGISMSDSNILLAFDYDGPGDFPALHFTWKDLLEDAKIDCVGKKNIEDEFTYPGGIFCTVCITYCEGGTRVEDGDLATHLRSETHEIETFGKTAKTLFHGELRLAYKWGAYLNIPLERMTQLLSNHPENKRKSKEGKMIKRKSKDRAEPTITENYAPSISPVDDKKEDVEEEHREIDLVDIFGSFTPEKDSAVEKDNVDIGGEEYEENLNKHLSITEEEIADVDDDYGSEGEQGLNAAEALRAQVNLEVQKRESSSSRSGSSSGSDSDGRSKSVSSGSGQSSSGTSSRGSGRSDDEVNSV